MRVLLVGLTLFAVACGGGPPSGTACNGRDELCARRYDAVTFAGTHDADSNIADGFGAPDQTYGLTRQLDDGIRVLHLEMQEYDGDVYLCHSLCEIGSRLLVDDLSEVAAWTKAHRRDVVTLLMESSDVSSDDIAARLKRAGLVSSLHAQTAGAPWPTLGARSSPKGITSLPSTMTRRTPAARRSRGCSIASPGRGRRRGTTSSSPTSRAATPTAAPPATACTSSTITPKIG